MLPLILLTFGITRLLMLQFPEGRQSTAFSIFASYGFEAAAASNRNVSVYEIRATNLRDSLRGSPSTIPGAGEIEYPPLAISWLALPALLIKGSNDGASRASAAERLNYASVLRMELAVVDAICLCLVAMTLRSVLLASRERMIGGIVSYVACSSLLFVLLYDRLDLVVGALILAALACHLSSLSIAWSFLLLGLAINFKVVALLIVPVWLIGSLPCGTFRKSLRHQVAVFAGRGVALALFILLPVVPYWLRDGPRIFDFLHYHAERGIQIESVAANVLFLLRPLGLRVDVAREFGSADVIALGTRWFSLTFTVAMLGALGVAFLKMRREVMDAARRFPVEVRVASAMGPLCVKYSFLSLLIGMCGAKVFSPQYLLWIVPIAPLVLLRDRKADVAFQGAVALLCFASLLVWPLLYSEVRPHSVLADGSLRFYPPTGIGVAILSIRSAALLAVAASLLKHDVHTRTALQLQVSS